MKEDRFHLTSFVSHNGSGYYVSTAFTFDHGLETMIFHATESKDDDAEECGCKVTDWRELYQKLYGSETSAAKWHSTLITLPTEEFLRLLTEWNNDESEEEEC